MDTARLSRARLAAAAVLDVDSEHVEVRIRGQGRGGGRPRARTDEEIRVAVGVSPSYRAAARQLGISDSTLRDACARLGIAPKSALDRGIDGIGKNRRGARKPP